MNELTPQSLEQWREERRLENRAARVAAFAARYLDDDGDSPISGTRDERIREGIRLGIITHEESASLLTKATDAAIDAMTEGASGADAYRDVSDAEFARMVRNAYRRSTDAVDAFMSSWLEAEQLRSGP